MRVELWIFCFLLASCFHAIECRRKSGGLFTGRTGKKNNPRKPPTTKKVSKKGKTELKLGIVAAMFRGLFIRHQLYTACDSGNDDYENSYYYITNVCTVRPDKEPIMYPMDIVTPICDATEVLVKRSRIQKMPGFVTQGVTALALLTGLEDYGKSTASFQYFIHLASFTGIPILTWNTDNNGIILDYPKYRAVQLAPPMEHQINAICAVLKRYHWKKFALVSTDISGYKRAYDLFYEKIKHDSENLEILKHVVISRPKRESETLSSRVRAVLKREVKNTDARIMVLYAKSEEAKVIMKIAKDEELAGNDYLWIGFQSTVDPGDFAPTETRNENRKASMPLVGMMGVYFEGLDSRRQARMWEPHALASVFLVMQKTINAMTEEYGDKYDLRSNASCLNEPNFSWDTGEIMYKKMLNVTVKKEEIASLAKDVAKKPLKVEPRLTYDVSFTAEGKLRDSVLSIINVRPNNVWEEVGTYRNQEDELKIVDITWPGDRAKPPQGTPKQFHMRIVFMEEAPFVMMAPLDPVTRKCAGGQGIECKFSSDNTTTTMSDYNNVGSNSSEFDSGIPSSNIRCCSGLVVDLLKKLSVDVGFTFDLFRVKDGKFGRKELGTGKWTGMIKAILDQEADMAATSLSLNSERATAVDFSIPFLETGIAIIVKLRRGAVSPTAFLEPFEYKTWVFILVISIQAAATSIFLFEWLSPQGYDKSNRPPPGQKFSLFRSYWLVWATLFSASVNTDVPRSHTARFMALVWAAFSLSFLAVYTANLAAFMITRSDHYDLTGIDDPRLSNPDKIPPFLQYGTVQGGNTHQTLEKNYHSQHRFIKSKAIERFKGSVREGVAAVKNGQLDAFIYDAVSLNYLAGKDDNCEILTVGKWFSRTGFGFGFPFKSPFKKAIEEQILSYQHKGDLERLQKFWLVGACTPKRSERKNHSTLGIENFMSAFVLLAGGCIVGMVILTMEYIYCKKMRKKIKKLDRGEWCGLLSLSMARSLTFDDTEEKEKEDSIFLKTKRELVLEQQLTLTLEELKAARSELQIIKDGGLLRKRTLRGKQYDAVSTEEPTDKKKSMKRKEII